MAHDPITGPVSGPVNKNKSKPVGKNRKTQAAKDDPSGPVGTRRGTKTPQHARPAPATAKRQPSRADMTKKKRTETGSQDGKDAVPAIRPKLTRRRGGSK
jgi:hypothetical protein